MSDKSVIVYYSWVGNTEVVAKEIQDYTCFNTQRIEEKRTRKSGKIYGRSNGSYMWH